MGFVDGSVPCPSRCVSPSGPSGVDLSNSSSSVNSDAYLIWMMHDRALIQLIIATLSLVAMSCAISNLQNIKKGTDTVAQYLQKIKVDRDYLTAAGVSFANEYIVILALNGLPHEYNTFHTVIRGREQQYGSYPGQQFGSNTGQQYGYSSQSSGPGYHVSQCSQPSMQAMHIVLAQPSQPSTSQATPQVWLTDSGTTNHMTADLNNLSLASPYPFNETIQTVNGEGLKDKATGRILFRGLCSNGLYPIHSLATTTLSVPHPKLQAKAFLGQLVNSTIWHGRLGHPSNSIVSLMLHKSNITCAKDSVVHSDPWGPAPCTSVDGYRYYVTFIDESSKLDNVSLPTSSVSFPLPVVTSNNVVVSLVSTPSHSSPLVTESISSSMHSIPSSLSPSSSFNLPVLSQSITAAESESLTIPVTSVHCPETLQVVLSVPPMNIHSMQTRSKSGIIKRKTFFSAVQSSNTTDPSLVEPTSHKSALKCPVWLTAVKEEIDALHRRLGAWCLCLPTRIWLVVNGCSRLRNILMLRFTTTYSDSSLFVKTVGSALVILLLYVDDIIIIGNDSLAIQQVIQSLTYEFDIKDLGPLHYFLGIQISSTANGLFLSQQKYVNDLLVKTEMVDSKPCDTLCLPYHRLLKDDGEPYNNPIHYRSVVGAMQYLTFTRPDIAFSVHQVCQFMQCPMVSHYTAVKRILRYLKGTMTYGLSYSHSALDIKAFSDADWAGDPNDRRSTTGLVVYLGSNPISWSSKKQQTITISSVPILFCDNMLAIALSFNTVQHQRTKHIEVDVHFVRERVAQNHLHVQFVSSKEQFANILTKGLNAPLFHTHCNNLMLGSSTHEFAGG
ncbi:uncharacterized protein [Malus domestica]|uniref:uncharacterized protein n=1 Tax=Malus domestica TaxID=3750 RepID=UPI00049921FA